MIIKLKKRKIQAFLVITALLILSSRNNSNPVSLGFCPTMAGWADELSQSKQVELVLFESTVDAIAAMNQGRVDAVLVERVARKEELSNPHELRLRDGFTIVSRERKLVLESQLREMEIHTAESSETITQYIPEAQNVVFHSSTETAISEGLDKSVFLNWNDYSDEMELIVVLDWQGQKVEKFRLPVIYAKDEVTLKKLSPSFLSRFLP